MRLVFVITIFLFLSFYQSVLYANESDTTVYYVVDNYPILIANGKQYKTEKISEFIKAHTFYPKDEVDCQGSVIISIIVEKNGTVKQKEIVRKLCPGYDREAMKVIDLMKKWKSGRINGKKVRTKLTLKVTWRLE
jgi:hypothetical protein